MLRISFLRNLMLLVLAILACLPLYTLLVLHPAYHRQLIADTEDDAVRFANYLVRDLQLEGVRLEGRLVTPAMHDQVQAIMADRQLVKLRFFSPGGEIVFSTDAAEIGRINRSPAFLDIVARGEVLSQVVKKDRKTADGVISRLDVVETYVPLAVAGQFGGAVEVYYDITRRLADIETLTTRTTLILVLISLGLLAAMVMALNKARVSLEERDRAERALLQVNEELESRVARRTAELSAANSALTDEIAERALAQQALSHALEESRRDREKFDGILRSVADGLVVTDRTLMVLHMNAAAEKLLEIPLENALGQPLDDLATATELPRLVRNLIAEDRGRPAVFDFVMPGESAGPARVCQARVSRLNSDQGQSGIILLLHDVTRERELDRLKNAFLGRAAHELNTPLAAILGFSELLLPDAGQVELSPEQQAEYLRLIHAKALELSRLVDDLLDISRVEAGQPLALDYRPVRCAELLRDILRRYQEKHPAHRFELHCPAEAMEIQADPERLRQVLDNLVSNAVKYSPTGGQIEVAVADRDGHCHISIADKGIGMTAEQAEQSFDNFYRADSSNTAVRGVGLGMSLVRHIVRAHHGEIRVDSAVGHGTVIHVDLPKVPPA